MDEFKIVNFGEGFKLEIVKTIPDVKGADLQGFLYHNGELVVDNVVKKYKTVKGLTNFFKNKVMVEYIKNNANKVFTIKYFREENSINEFVTAYMDANTINWGEVIDVIGILRAYGYIIPEKHDRDYDAEEWQEWMEVVNDIGAEILKRLKSHGFGADRNTSNRDGHVKTPRHPNCYNLIFTRYPWTSAYKIIKSVMSFLSISGMDFFAGQNYSEFKNKDPEAYEFILALREYLKDINVEMHVIVSNTGFRKASLDFVQYMNEHKYELQAKYKKRSPINYDNHGRL